MRVEKGIPKAQPSPRIYLWELQSFSTDLEAAHKLQGNTEATEWTAYLVKQLSGYDIHSLSFTPAEGEFIVEPGTCLCVDKVQESSLDPTVAVTGTASPLLVSCHQNEDHCVTLLSSKEARAAAWLLRGDQTEMGSWSNRFGDRLDRVDCYSQAVVLDHTNGRAWFQLAQLLTHPKTSIWVNGFYVGIKECVQNALQHKRVLSLAEVATAWRRLSELCKLEPIHTLHGELFSADICLTEAKRVSALSERCDAVHSDLNDSTAWNGLGLSMKADEEVAVNGKSYTKPACYQEALRCDPTNGSAWSNLGSTISRDQSVNVLGEQYTQHQCFLRALHFDPNYSYAWTNPRHDAPWRHRHCRWQGIHPASLLRGIPTP